MADPSTRRTHRPPPRYIDLTAAQGRALQAMARAPELELRGFAWTTLRALRSLGLCELGPGRRGRLTPAGRESLRALTDDAEEPPASGVNPTIGC
jgi:hypothetical protein